MDPVMLMQYAVALGLAGGVAVYIWNAAGSQGTVAEILADDRNRNPLDATVLDEVDPYAGTETMRRDRAAANPVWRWNGPIYYTDNTSARKRSHDPKVTIDDHMPQGDMAEVP